MLIIYKFQKFKRNRVKHSSPSHLCLPVTLLLLQGIWFVSFKRSSLRLQANICICVHITRVTHILTGKHTIQIVLRIIFYFSLIYFAVYSVPVGKDLLHFSGCVMLHVYNILLNPSPLSRCVTPFNILYYAAMKDLISVILELYNCRIKFQKWHVQAKRHSHL